MCSVHVHPFLTRFLGVLTVCTLASCPATAAWKQIKFEGTITTQTCEAKINGEEGSVVKLKDVRDRELSKYPSRAGLTTFTLAIGNCSHAEDGVQKVRVFVRVPEGQSLSSGYLLNTVAVKDGGASSVGLEVTKDGAGAQPVKLPLNSAASATSIDLEESFKDGTATYTFGVQYVHYTPLVLSPGKFAASLMWDIAYL